MFKKEWVYREIACSFLEDRNTKFTELALSRKFGISLSTVHHALAPLKHAGIVYPISRGFRLSGLGRLLSFWATQRALRREVLLRMPIASATSAEKEMPSGVIFGGYAAYRMRYKEAPADYSELIVYASDAQAGEIRRRLSGMKGNSTLLVLKKDPFLSSYAKAGICPDPQVYVDLWNMKEWYAADFRRALGKRMGLNETVLE
jgi:DNA-binding transcriptional ArsR family regulator